MKATTKKLLMIAVAVLLSYDGYVATNATEGDTISEVLIELGSQYPIVAVLIGCVVGHLWWPLQPIRNGKQGDKS
jgi:uncharacterized membrane protein YwzB